MPECAVAEQLLTSRTVVIRSNIRTFRPQIAYVRSARMTDREANGQEQVRIRCCWKLTLSDEELAQKRN